MSNNDNTLKGFVKHPSRDSVDMNQPNANLTITEVEIAGNPEYPDWLPLLTRPDKFSKSSNPIHAIESIILCHESGLYPPLTILDWLVDALKKWHEQSGRVSLDKALGLKKSGQTGNAWREAIKEDFESGLMVELNRLRHMFYLTNRQAAEMIVCRLENTEWNLSGFKLPIYSEETLVDKFERKWAKLFSDKEGPPRDVGNKFRNAAEEEKREVLLHYPRHSYEHLPQMKQFL